MMTMQLAEYGNLSCICILTQTLVFLSHVVDRIDSSTITIYIMCGYLIQMQGRYDAGMWIQRFWIESSDDGITWNDYTHSDGRPVRIST